MSKFTQIIAGLAIAAVALPSLVSAEISTTTVQSQLNAIKNTSSQIKAHEATQQQNVSALLTTLNQGSQGDAVQILQALLAADPSIYPEGLITGFFGPKTAAAVKRFQKENGLPQVGRVGPLTLAKLNKLLETHEVAFEDNDDNDGNGGHGKKVCAKVPPGHLIAPGWLKKHDNEKPIVPECQKLPPGIEKKMGTSTHATSTDMTAPIISGVSVSNVGSTTATIGWLTNELANGKVYYGTSTPVLTASTTFTVSTSTVSGAHAFNLGGLTASSTYYFVVESSDIATNKATSSQQSFVTAH
jgi:peptidoglycan hydrolase-like protein with peptidoglycan-binding domain